MANRPQPKRLPSLMDEPPIAFFPSLAKQFKSVNKALIVQQLHFLIQGKMRDKHQYTLIDGEQWVYNSYDQWVDSYLIWLTPSGVKKLMLELERDGIIETRQGVKNKMDRKKWYRLNYDALEKLLDASDTLYPMEELQNIQSSGYAVDDVYTESTTESTAEMTKIMPPAAKSAAGSAGTRDVDSTSADDISDDVLADDVAADDAGRVEESAATKKPRPQTAAAALNEALLGALRIDVPTKSDYGKAGKVRKELADAYERATGQAMTPEDVRVFVAYVESEARKQNWTLTLTSLTNNGRLSAWLSTRPKNGASPTQNDAPTQYVPRPEWLNMSRREWAVQAVRDAIAQGWTVEAIAVAHDSTPDVVRALAEN